ncbi:MAG: DUF1579 domain-containing protein [Planctomycetes bacterium]|nr:DUF1579 domain-containing protein [Planctomycetota bacterium]
MRTRLTQATIALTAIVGLALGLLAVSVHAQSETAKPSPEIKKLEVLVGDWRYEGEQFEPPAPGLPFGGAGKFFGTVTSRFVLNGFFLEAKIEDNSPGGKTSSLQMTGYDANSKKYVEHSFASDGTISVATATLEGQTYTVSSTMTTATGKKVLLKSVATYTSDWSRQTGAVEASIDDGKTWKPWWKGEGRKVKK